MMLSGAPVLPASRLASSRRAMTMPRSAGVPARSRVCVRQAIIVSHIGILARHAELWKLLLVVGIVAGHRPGPSSLYSRQPDAPGHLSGGHQHLQIFGDVQQDGSVGRCRPTGLVGGYRISPV